MTAQASAAPVQGAGAAGVGRDGKAQGSPPAPDAAQEGVTGPVPHGSGGSDPTSYLMPEAARLIRDRMRGDAPRPRRRNPRLPQSKRRTVFNRDGWTCVLCGSRDDLTLDHIVPYSRGGSSRLENLQTLCLPCNAAKADAEWGDVRRAALTEPSK